MMYLVDRHECFQLRLNGLNLLDVRAVVAALCSARPRLPGVVGAAPGALLPQHVEPHARRRAAVVAQDPHLHPIIAKTAFSFSDRHQTSLIIRLRTGRGSQLANDAGVRCDGGISEGEHPVCCLPSLSGRSPASALPRPPRRDSATCQSCRRRTSSTQGTRSCKDQSQKGLRSLDAGRG